MTDIRLDRASTVPLHAQVEQLLREMIRRGEYQDGRLLPDEMSLARRLGVSRATIRTGISRLVFEGLLERRAGIGTRVAQAPVLSGIGAWHSFTHEMERKGIQVENYSIRTEIEPASEEVASRLQIADGPPTLRLDRLRGWDGEPVVRSRSWLHPRLRLAADTDFHGPLYEVIEREASVIADRSFEEMSAVGADEEIAALLRVPPGTPLLLRRLVIFDPGGHPIEFAVVHYRSDRLSLTMNIRRETS